ncbi:hypothetical protein G6L37_06935 [Agrobacterium rubi]|nr:hypothetical protein [Agrobacterium rubi]NTF25100.1 hypothetical protein [Agrobacterium rubi]
MTKLKVRPVEAVRFLLAFCLVTAPVHPAVAATASDNAELISEVDGCRTWRVRDDLGQGDRYARIEGRTIYFTKCSASTDTAEKAAPIRGDVPKNATPIAEADGCRVWRITDGEGKVQAAATLEPRYLYFTKCGNMTVPTVESGMR